MIRQSDIATIEHEDYHEVIQVAFTSCKAHYKQFLNWVSGEFELYLQEEDSGLKIHFPNGSIHIKPLANIRNLFEFKMAIRSKNKIKVQKMNKQLLDILEHVKGLNKPI